MPMKIIIAIFVATILNAACQKKIDKLQGDREISSSEIVWTPWKNRISISKRGLMWNQFRHVYDAKGNLLQSPQRQGMTTDYFYKETSNQEGKIEKCSIRGQKPPPNTIIIADCQVSGSLEIGKTDDSRTIHLYPRLNFIAMIDSKGGPVPYSYDAHGDDPMQTPAYLTMRRSD